MDLRFALSMIRICKADFPCEDSKWSNESNIRQHCASGSANPHATTISTMPWITRIFLSLIDGIYEYHCRSESVRCAGKVNSDSRVGSLGVPRTAIDL